MNIPIADQERNKKRLASYIKRSYPDDEELSQNPFRDVEPVFIDILNNVPSRDVDTILYTLFYLLPLPRNNPLWGINSIKSALNTLSFERKFLLSKDTINYLLQLNNTDLTNTVGHYLRMEEKW